MDVSQLWNYDGIHQFETKFYQKYVAMMIKYIIKNI